MWPAEKIVKTKTTALTPYARNARTHSEAQIAQIAASIREWGWTTPILADETGLVIAGHGRLLAAQRLGITEVPVMVAKGWTEAQKKAYTLADNQLAMNAGWNDEFLRLELQELKDWEFDCELIGFENLDALLAEQTEGLTDPDAVPEVSENVLTQPGDIWTLGRHRLMCGDSTVVTDVDRLLDGVQPHLMVTDPPYGVEYNPRWRADAGVNKSDSKMGVVANDDRADWRDAWALFPGDVAYVWHADRMSSVVVDSLESCGFKVRAQIIWVKDRFALSRGDYHHQHEPCWYAVRNRGHWAGDRKQSTVWKINAREDGGHGHGTQKPVECMKRPIENNSSPGQAVYEPFSGSGTTIIACETTGRACYAMELSPEYVDVAVRRWQEFTGKIALLNGEEVKEAAHA